jgi:IclR family KDG regulon transcriptional repressor
VKIVESVSRALDIIDLLGESTNGMRLTELSRALDIPHPTVYRLLNTLSAKGFVVQEEESSRYYLSTRILRLQGNIARRLSLVERSVPILNHLVQELSMVSHLAILSEDQVVYLESRRQDWYSGYYYPTGRSGDAHSTALGKVLLAFLPDDQCNTLVNRLNLVSRTPYTITDRDEFKRHLDTIRQRGYAIDEQESSLDSYCVAAPIRNPAGHAIAALSVSTSPSAVRHENLERMIQAVIRGAKDISREMGWYGQENS